MRKRDTKQDFFTVTNMIFYRFQEMKIVSRMNLNNLDNNLNNVDQPQNSDSPFQNMLIFLKYDLFVN